MNRVFLFTPANMSPWDAGQLQRYLTTSRIPTATQAGIEKDIYLYRDKDAFSNAPHLLEVLAYGELRKTAEWANTAVVFSTASSTAHFLAGLMQGHGKRAILIADGSDQQSVIDWIYPEVVQGFEEAFDLLKGAA
ncbi:hypothetical protein TRICHSKD4_3711 [Roseibium sp. TrichSKD4]|uniref:hypothetical protein n=1 Tax=Roseibium sp. TrichSKD4 TaxID=744980 RepID=UPI0001E56B5C|nr:hypothetical protein [Roseibium sp. TrichSKD4]EFO30136.1 hypothetical protein TRICHSKD4_3711 [Roseibium sp. TrichSKD4]